MSFKISILDRNSWCIEDEVSRAYLFKGSDRALLVDTTNGPGDLLKEVTKLIGSMPVQLLNTHADGDHIGCNNQFDTTLMHPSEFAYYMTKCKKGDAIPIPVQDGDCIDLGERCFEVIHMPGHTYGSIILLNKN
ncbi:MAG: MBL fold metallo-hydrolase, partial [Bacteroides thetaiotaomicron]|nr:MBL fold metallo-hydrolase [Bacteroides thetaiotaomicron]